MRYGPPFRHRDSKGYSRRGSFPNIIFFLLRVGKYIQKRRKGNTRTIQFRWCDIAFKNGNTIVPRNAPASEVLAATGATLRLSNQKNGIRGSLVHWSATGGKFCLVLALARQFLHMRENKAKEMTFCPRFGITSDNRMSLMRTRKLQFGGRHLI